MNRAEYTIQKSEGRKREGSIEWDAIPVLRIDHVLWLPDAGIRAQGQLCYDEENLYVQMRRSYRTETLSGLETDQHGKPQFSQA